MCTNFSCLTKNIITLLTDTLSKQIMFTQTDRLMESPMHVNDGSNFKGNKKVLTSEGINVWETS